MNSSANTLDDDNAHVQELKRLFLSSNVDENQCINADGLIVLCDKLKLGPFAKEIAERVLGSAETVDFYNFKERFVSYLPEIIDVSSGTVDPLVTRAQQTAFNLGYGDGQRLTRYETRIVCENTPELEQLSVVDINGLFERADVDRVGRVSVQQFLSQYRLQKRLSAEVHFIADSYVSSLNLFEALDPGKTGTIDSHELLEYWNKSGLRIDEGLAVLKESGQTMSGLVNAIYLSGFLERELSEAANAAPVAVKSAIIALHCCIDHLRCTVRESESRAEHLHKQLQAANQRRTMLIEELEHNQMVIEQGYEKRLRETEDRYRARVQQMEEKFRMDKREIQNEMEQVEEELSRAKQSETSTRSKMHLIERQNARLNEESRELAETVQQLEQLNRQLRTELSKAMQPRPVEDNTQLMMWKQKIELLVAHNKRLREKVQDLTTAQKKRSKMANDGESLTRWSTAFRVQVMNIRKRRLARGDTLSEMDSEPESIFVRHRKRRLLKRKDRKMRHERVNNRIQLEDSDTSCSSSKPDQLVVKQYEMQLNKLKDDQKKEISSIKQNSSKMLTDALAEQEKQFTIKIDRERKQWESRFANEKGQMEDRFADEKLKLMNRLQEDFDAELKRFAAAAVNRPEQATIEQYKRQIKQLETTLEGQKIIYEKRLSDLKEKYKNTLKSQSQNPYQVEKNTTNFLSLVEKYRNHESAPSSARKSASATSGLAIEKFSSTNQYQRSNSIGTPKCEKCDMVNNRLRELHHTISGDISLVESGIEDLGSSAGSQIDDKIVLKREIRKLKGRLDAAKEKVTELRVLLSMHSPTSKYRCSLGGSEEAGGDWRRHSNRSSDESSAVERLESEKLLLEARLNESQLLIKSLVEQYRKQLDETNLLSTILRDVYAHTSVPATATPTSAASATSEPVPQPSS